MDDKRQGAGATAADKLTLSKGAVAGKSNAEQKIAEERAKRDADTRVAELARNVDELKKLKGQTTEAAASAASVVAGAGVKLPVSPPVAVAPSPPEPKASTPSVDAVVEPKASTPSVTTEASAPVVVADAASAAASSPEASASAAT